uniref:Uncharacterized protein n=1 Tax=Picea glauca TaxID=3330 RepID=A0A117NJ04_PICGL|nr:hypothetical protein ABT39_MTgene536 [Picea glauca]
MKGTTPHFTRSSVPIRMLYLNRHQILWIYHYSLGGGP